MAAPVSKVYGNTQKHLDVDVDWAADNIKATLHTSAYTPNQSTDEFFSAVTGELAVVSTTLAASATATATSVSLTASIAVGNTITIGSGGTVDTRVVTAISGAGPFTATVAALTNAHASGEAVVAGSGYTAGGLLLGTKSVTVTGLVTAYKAAASTWTAGAGLALGARYIVVRKDTGTAATSPVLVYVLLDSAPADVTATGAALTATWDATDGVFKITAV